MQFLVDDPHGICLAVVQHCIDDGGDLFRYIFHKTQCKTYSTFVFIQVDIQVMQHHVERIHLVFRCCHVRPVEIIQIYRKQRAGFVAELNQGRQVHTDRRRDVSLQNVHNALFIIEDRQFFAVYRDGFLRQAVDGFFDGVERSLHVLILAYADQTDQRINIVYQAGDGFVKRRAVFYISDRAQDVHQTLGGVGHKGVHNVFQVSTQLHLSTGRTGCCASDDRVAVDRLRNAKRLAKAVQILTKRHALIRHTDHKAGADSVGYVRCHNRINKDVGMLGKLGRIDGDRVFGKIARKHVGRYGFGACFFHISRKAAEQRAVGCFVKCSVGRFRQNSCHAGHNAPKCCQRVACKGNAGEHVVCILQDARICTARGIALVLSGVRYFFI